MRGFPSHEECFKIKVRFALVTDTSLVCKRRHAHAYQRPTRPELHRVTEAPITS